MADRLASDLQLTPEQQTELAELFAGRRERFDGFHRVKPLDAPHGLTLARPPEVRARFKQEQRALQDAVREILTAEQGEVFDGLWQPGRRGLEGTRRPSGTLDRREERVNCEAVSFVLKMV